MRLKPRLWLASPKPQPMLWGHAFHLVAFHQVACHPQPHMNSPEGGPPPRLARFTHAAAPTAPCPPSRRRVSLLQQHPQALPVGGDEHAVVDGAAGLQAAPRGVAARGHIGAGHHNRPRGGGRGKRGQGKTSRVAEWV